jgi:phage terminase large subunit-like protein
LPHKQEFKTQLLDFPNGEHDDMVDIVGFAVFAMINFPMEIPVYETSFVGASSSGGMRI